MQKFTFFMNKLLLVFLFLPFIGTAVSAEGQQDDERMKIGYVCNNFNDPFQTYVLAAFEDYCRSSGDAEIVLKDALEDVIRQRDIVDTLIMEKVDALVVVPVDTSAMAPIVQAAGDAGIPLCFVNRNPFAGKVLPENVYYVGSREIVAGRQQMEYLGELLDGKGGIAILMGKLDNEGALKRTEGIDSVIAEQFPEIKVLARESGNWMRDQGRRLTKNWINSYGQELNGILANNDEMALGAIEALDDAGRNDVLVMGIDALPAARNAVRNGVLAGTVLQDATGQGEGAARLIHRILSGERVDPITWIPFVLMKPDNLDSSL